MDNTKPADQHCQFCGGVGCVRCDARKVPQAVPSIPSREAVDSFTPSNGAMICCYEDTGAYVAIADYRKVLAEVERLTGELAFEKRDRVMADAAAESLRATVAAQAAALEMIANIAEGSTTANSLPNIVKIARAALASQRSGPREPT